MSADHDGDSQMVSSVEDSDSDRNTQTPLNQTAQPGVVSPPDSQHRSAMPPSATGAAISNANGKRPINTISNGADEEELAGMLGANGKTRQEFPPKTHERSGYTWNRAEDEPGYAWLNKKAVDEYQRAWDSLVHKDHMVKGRYGDPFEAVDKERALLNSLKQQ
ncbi:hypothetical protein LTR37_021166 [Vermiconidia calcicola]|uniref:Uncharacterized protein n=1 Tax=Vermiconidia calcicola TaxID=1690605 RepID=A0ACC3M977_9PEZI|nr:hypothetical protein LTR37_021166 [Vermiconidia calcicola]